MTVPIENIAMVYGLVQYLGESLESPAISGSTIVRSRQNPTPVPRLPYFTILDRWLFIIIATNIGAVEVKS